MFDTAVDRYKKADSPLYYEPTTQKVDNPFVHPPSLVALDDQGMAVGPQELTFDLAEDPPIDELPLVTDTDVDSPPPPPFWQGTLGGQPEVRVEPRGRFGAGALALALAIGLAVGIGVGYWRGISAGGGRSARVADPTSREYTDAPVAQPPVAARESAAAPNPVAPAAPATIPLDAPSATTHHTEPVAPLPPVVPPAERAASNPTGPPPPTKIPSEISPKRAAGAESGRAAVAPGRILVRTTPGGAQVTVDGVARGETPVAVRDLDLGTHTVAIVHEGHAPIERRVTLTANRPSRSIEERLAVQRTIAAPAPAPAAASSETGVLEIDSRPVGARVTVDGRAMGATPLVLPAVTPGTYTVRLERAGYRPWSTTVHITSGQRARVAASLVGGQGQE